MKSLLEVIKEAESRGEAVGHFNFSNLEGFWGIVRAADRVGRPVILGLSEGEGDFVGLDQAVALVRSIQDQISVPVFLNADHFYSVEKVTQATRAGFDSVIFDAGEHTLEENISQTKKAIEAVRQINPDIVTEGEIGYIGKSSKLLEEIPADFIEKNYLTDPDEAKKFVVETGVDLLAPAVGNIHGMLRHSANPELDIKRIRDIREACGVPLVLHGGSGITKANLTSAIQAGVAVVHVNTEIRVAFRDSAKISLMDNPDEIAPYKIMKPAVLAVEKVVEEKLRIFANMV